MYFHIIYLLLRRRQFVSLWLAECYKKREIKSLEKATKFRVSGNKKFQEKNYGSCIELYTKSAIYAPADSEDLAVSIANRSASFFYLNRYSVSFTVYFCQCTVCCQCIITYQIFIFCILHSVILFLTYFIPDLRFIFACSNEIIKIY